MGFDKFIKDLGKSVQDAGKNIKLPEIEIPDLGKVFSDAVDQGAAMFNQKNAAEQNAEQKTEISEISIPGALGIMYAVLMADGVLTPEEDKRFSEIGTEMAGNYESLKPEIVQSFEKSMSKAIDPEDREEIVFEFVDENLRKPVKPKESLISSELLLWDLMVLAYSDGVYSEPEKKLIKHVFRKLNVDQTKYREMENSLLALHDLENEIDWIKQTDRPYTRVEKEIRQLQERQNQILKNVEALINL